MEGKGAGMGLDLDGVWCPEGDSAEITVSAGYGGGERQSQAPESPQSPSRSHSREGTGQASRLRLLLKPSARRAGAWAAPAPVAAEWQPHGRGVSVCADVYVCVHVCACV